MGDNLDTDATDAKTTKRRSVEVEVTSKRWGSDGRVSEDSVKYVKVPIIGESSIRLDITVDLRKTDTIVIRPVRRDMDDVSGLISDATKLAND